MSFVTHEVSDVELPIIYNTNFPPLGRSAWGEV